MVGGGLLLKLRVTELTLRWRLLKTNKCFSTVTKNSLDFTVISLQITKFCKNDSIVLFVHYKYVISQLTLAGSISTLMNTWFLSQLIWLRLFERLAFNSIRLNNILCA